MKPGTFIALLTTSLALGFSAAAQTAEPRAAVVLEPTAKKTAPVKPAAPSTCTVPCVETYIDVQSGTGVLILPLDHPTR